MNNVLNITSRQSLESITYDVISSLFPNQIDYIYCEHRVKGRGLQPRYFLTLKTHGNMSSEVIASCLTEWILDNLEHIFASNILKERFISFSNTETDEILKNALKSIDNKSRSYNKKIIVKKLTDYLKSNKTLSLEGFLRFRSKEYCQMIEEYLFYAIEDFFADKEYMEFLELLRIYVSEAKPLINLIHIKFNCDGSFSLYNFKQTEIVLDPHEINLQSDIISEGDKLVSILLTLIPKRIIWHNNCRTKNMNLVNTIKEIFDNRFCECKGCQLCCKENPEFL